MALPVAFDRETIIKLVTAADRKLDQIEARLPCLSVSYADLAKEDTCKAVFQHCLPYQHDQDHWKRLDRTNIQIDLRSFFADTHRLRSNLNSLASILKTETFRRASSWQL
jgi:P2-related tail formation protein